MPEIEAAAAGGDRGLDVWRVCVEWAHAEEVGPGRGEAAGYQ